MINKDEIINQLSETNQQLTKNEIYKVVDSLFDIISNELVKGNEVKISKFGLFIPKKREDKKIYDPATKLMRFIPSHTVIEFRESVSLKEKLKK